MATLAETKTRIITELNRDDMGSGGGLETVLASAIDRAIEFHADEAFWFNRKSGTTVTVAATATAVLPTGMRIPLVVSYNAVPLTKVALEEIEYKTDAGTPTHWAENEGTIQLWPIPGSVLTLSVQGIAELGTPASAASNEWTTTALDLTVATAKKFLCRDALRDPDGEASAGRAETDYLTKLRRESRRRGRVNLTSDLPIPHGFNIVTG